MNKKKGIIAGSLIALVLIVTVVAIVTASHHSSAKSTTNGTALSATTNKVAIQNYMFMPMVTTVKVGTTVTWTNSDSVSHTITADTTSARAPSSMDIADGKSYSFTFSKAGTYTYHCFPHPYMHGTVVVTN